MNSLRARLLAVVAILAIAYVALAFVIVSSQRSLLLAQTDKRLHEAPVMTMPFGDSAARPPVQEAQVGATPVAGSNTAPGATTPTDATVQLETPFSDFYMGFVAADRSSVTPLVAGTILDSVPDLVAAVSATRGERGTVTVHAESGDERFRALVLPESAAGGWIVITQSLAEVDAAVARLIRTLVLAGIVLAAVLGAIVFWVQRLGLRPIARVTAAAEAIAAGDRSYRLSGEDTRTEAGRLAHAFNLMLDERDQSDVRFRQFVADASHELRTPLTSVRGYLELYREGAFRESGEMDDAVRRMSSETTRMYGLVEDLLVLASLDEGRPLHRDVVDLGQILRDAAQDAGAVQPARPIVAVAPERGPVVVGDGSLLVQCVGILVANALAHTPERADVTLTAAHDGERTLVTVADKGPGLDAESARHVFDRFWRGSRSRERARGQGRSGGAGLGLSIARSIVEAHGGTISVQSTPGLGTTFVISLPRQGGAGRM
ncbi:MAG TPA: HAMP domain-containing sensor histidine kinase [Thermomicrobiales bacterium]|jgi:two-component system, OmpR family, sensor kinase|nr:HAMP domain-containing sensor histidine kinase [Thermomicrobiales bacterium]